jgi:aryl-alcohol dehydrogenase-like predicted oxidoreductase
MTVDRDGDACDAAGMTESIASTMVRIGRTDVRVSALGLGGTPFGDMYAVVPDETAFATVRAAFDAGVRYFDTAPLYGVGKAERRLGLGIAGLPRDEITISTKVGRLLQDDDGTMPPTFEYGPEAVVASLESSLERLGIDRVDIVHVHDPDDHLDEVIDTTLPLLQEMKASGRIGAVSAGMNHAGPLARFVEAGLVECVMVAGRWTLLDQSALRELLPAASSQGVSVIAAGVFNSGVLADPDGPHANYFYATTPADVLAMVRRIRDICGDHGVSLRAAALRFPLTHPAVATVCIGCRSPQEVADNVAALEETVPHELWSALAAAELLAPDAVPPISPISGE